MKHSVFAGALVSVLGSVGVSVDRAVALDTAPKQVAGQVSVPTGEAMLGTVRIPRRVLADGKPLPPGTYQIRVTAQSATPAAVGQLPELSRWAEFLQGGEVKGREVLTIVPGNELDQVAESQPPSVGSAKVEMLRGDDYLRIWIERSETHYLIHLPPG